MKIAVATDDQISVCGHVGKCKGFMIFSIDSGKILNKEFRENIFTNHHNKSSTEKDDHRHGGGHGHGDGHKRLAEGLNDCDYLISHGMGRKLVEDIQDQGIKPIITVELDAEEAALKLEKGTIKTDNNLICG